MTKRLTWLSTSLVLLLLSSSLIGCKKAAPPQTRPPSPVNATTAKKMNIPLSIAAFGRLSAAKSVDVVPQVSGKLLTITFDEGQTVKAGDILFTIDDSEYKAMVMQAEAAVQQAQSSLDKKKQTLARNDDLVTQGLVSKENYDSMKTDVDMANAQLESAKAALEQARVNLDYCTIHAPIDGITGKRLIDAGNIVSPSAGSLVNIRSINRLFADFSVSEAFLSEIREAAKDGEVDVIISEHDNIYGGFTKGTLSFIGNTIDTSSGTIALRAEVDNADMAFWPGTFVDLVVLTLMQDGAIVVPAPAIAVGKDGPYAYIIGAGDKVEYRAIKKGRSIGSSVIILDGIKKGEKVVTSAQLGLYPGATVQMVPTTSKEQEKAYQQKLDNPKIQTILRQMRQAGVPTEEISVLSGLPEDMIENFYNTLESKKSDSSTDVM
ncbi:MAG: efflux RND transporter periplasmic adaptor subunit [Spartobacteria bacterium]|nr:efflux RND transporter periplasmic adaptor subunit [Spartobacteria bacterium]